LDKKLSASHLEPLAFSLCCCWHFALCTHNTQHNAQVHSTSCAPLAARLIGALAAVFNNPRIRLRSRELLLASCWLRAALFSAAASLCLWRLQFSRSRSSVQVSARQAVVTTAGGNGNGGNRGIRGTARAQRCGGWYFLLLMTRAQRHLSHFLLSLVGSVGRTGRAQRVSKIIIMGVMICV
jgi:hypothetical protein